jgi:adenylate cyclase
MSEQTAIHKLTAILYADVAGYSRLTGGDELGTHQKVMDALDFATGSIKAGGGTVLRYAGDAILAEFSSVVAAVTAAVAIQTELDQRNEDVPTDDKVQVRIGVNLGEVLQDRGEIYGDGVNLAARLESAAQPGGICISSAVYDQVLGKVDVNFEDGGDESFKNIAKPIHVYHWHPALVNVNVQLNVNIQGNAPQSKQPSTKEKPSVAVLPFDNMSGDPEQEYLADGISEDLITALSKIRWFMVIARNSTFTYKGKAVDVKQVASDLSVRYVLEGSVRKAGNRVRITAQLIDASTGHHVWAEKYDREIKDMFDLQDEMTQTIVGALEPELNAAERELVINRPPENLDAWASYQRGLWHMWRYEKDEVPAALRLLERAVELDPAFATAYAYKCYAHYQTVVMGWAEDPEQSLDEGMAAAKRALSLDDKDSVAYFALGRIHMMRGEHDASIRALEKSLSLNPSFAQSHHGLGMVLALAGRLDEARAALEQAERLSPRDPILWASTVVHSLADILAGDYKAAIHWAQRTLELPSAKGYWPHAAFAAASAHLDQLEDARSAVTQALKEKPDLSCSYLKKTLPTKHEGGLEPYLSGLRKAGLPE